MLVELFTVLSVTILLFFLYRLTQKKNIQYFRSEQENSEYANSEIDSLPMNYEITDVLLEPLNPDTVIYIETKSQLESMILKLNQSAHIGVDIEESREDSYLGYICLIQIATDTNVYLIDTIKLRKEIISLQPIFINKKIIKIFHGSHNDTQWLLRDFGIISVNIFDTQLAAQYIGLPKLGLNYLWKRYCNYIMTSEYKKQMQTSR